MLWEQRCLRQLRLGIYPKVEDAMIAMGQGFDVFYEPDAKRKKLYYKRYKKYIATGKFIEEMTLNYERKL